SPGRGAPARAGGRQAGGPALLPGEARSGGTGQAAQPDDGAVPGGRCWCAPGRDAHSAGVPGRAAGEAQLRAGASPEAGWCPGDLRRAAGRRALLALTYADAARPGGTPHTVDRRGAVVRATGTRARVGSPVGRHTGRPSQTAGGATAMSIGDIAGLIAAIAFVLLVGALAVPLLKLGRVMDEPRRSLAEATEHTLPVIDEAASTISSTNGQIAKVDTVTTAAAEVSTNVSALTSLVAATVGAPLIKMAAFSMA